jgi:hypothetical protein
LTNSPNDPKVVGIVYPPDASIAAACPVRTKEPYAAARGAKPATENDAPFPVNAKLPLAADIEIDCTNDAAFPVKPKLPESAVRTADAAEVVSTTVTLAVSADAENENAPGSSLVPVNCLVAIAIAIPVVSPDAS